MPSLKEKDWLHGGAVCGSADTGAPLPWFARGAGESRQAFQPRNGLTSPRPTKEGWVEIAFVRELGKKPLTAADNRLRC